MSRIDNTEVGRLMRRWREAAGWSQTEAAERAGMGQSAWSRVEAGTRPLRLSEGIAYAQALGVDVLALTRDPLDVLREVRL